MEYLDYHYSEAKIRIFSFLLKFTSTVGKPLKNVLLDEIKPAVTDKFEFE